MKRLHISAANLEDFGFLIARTGCAMTSDFSAIKATDSRGCIRGMVGYCNRTPNAVQVHIAVDSPIAWRSLLQPGLEYPFIQNGLGVLLAIIASSNGPSMRFAGRLGFIEKCRVKDGQAPGVDLVFLELRREHCRHISEPRRAA